MADPGVCRSSYIDSIFFENGVLRAGGGHVQGNMCSMIPAWKSSVFLYPVTPLRSDSVIFLLLMFLLYIKHTKVVCMYLYTRFRYGA